MANVPRESAVTIKMLTPYIGLTRDWGFPVFDRPTAHRIERWKRLPLAPWPHLAELPDVILIDGRMRVACCPESLLRVGRETTILVDDYAGRSYSAIERFAELINLHGRMAEFRKRSDFDELSCRVELQKAYSDLR
jgi:hypothetical protein